MGKTKFSKPSKPLTQEHVGQRYGRLVVEAETFKPRKNGAMLRWWKCICDCGTRIDVAAHQAKSGHTQSCGCFRRQQLTVHGMSKDRFTTVPEYGVWIEMNQRTSNPNNRKYARYGGRGITVCERWKHSFANFLEDMGRRPAGKHSIERRNNNLGYSPENCKWGTYAEQNRNHSRNYNITFQGRTMCLMDWATLLDMSHTLLRSRLKKWTIEKALVTPLHPTKGRPRGSRNVKERHGKS